MNSFITYSPYIVGTLLISLTFLIILSALERAFEVYSVIRYEVDKKTEKKYALVMEELLDSQYNILSSLRGASNLFLVLLGVSFASLFSNIVFGIAIAFIVVLLLTKLLPYYVATIQPAFVLRHFVYLAKVIHTLFSPFTGKVIEMTHQPEREESNEIAIIQNALNFSEVKVRECMIPRTEICALPDSATPSELLSKFAESKYSRILIYSGSIDKIIGYVHSKDLFAGDLPLASIIRKIDYVSEEMIAEELLATLIKTKRSIAVVNDEYGGTAGIVTLEDLIEEIFGEISDELDKEELYEKQLSKNEFYFSGRLEIKYLNKNYDLDLPESDEYETLGGFINWFNQDIPEKGEHLRYQNFEFIILETGFNRVESVTLRIVEE